MSKDLVPTSWVEEDFSDVVHTALQVIGYSEWR